MCDVRCASLETTACRLRDPRGGGGGYEFMTRLDIVQRHRRFLWSVRHC